MVSNDSTSFPLRTRTGPGVALLAMAGIIFYFAGQRSNPPGFFTDECSIAYNAFTIAQHGVDEWGVRFPLFFRAFGEYKNPTFIYLLAAVFKVVPPSALVARRVAAVCGYAACLVIGALGWRLSRSRTVAALTFAMAVLTPMLFEISRLVFEVALYPLATALFLLSVRRAQERQRWTVADILAIASTLCLLTYTYSTGRLFAPLLALALLIFYNAARRTQIVAVLVLYVLVGIVPLIAFNRRHEGALTRRFQQVSYLDKSRPLATLVAFERHFAANLAPLAMAFRGDPNSRHHVQESGGSILLVTLVLAAAGALHRSRWTWFLIAGTLASLIPASLTIDDLHALRLSAYPVFLIALSIPPLDSLRRKRALLAAVCALGLLQAGFFIWRFETTGANRRAEFSAGADRVLDEALAQGQRPIHTDAMARIHALWFGALRGVDPTAFTIDPPSRPGDLVFGWHAPPPDAIVTSHHGIFWAWVVP